MPISRTHPSPMHPSPTRAHPAARLAALPGAGPGPRPAHRHPLDGGLARRAAACAGAFALGAGLAASPAIAQEEGQQQPEGRAAQTGPYTTPAGFEQMVADKLPSVVGILSTAPQEMQEGRPRIPRLPPGFEDFFGPPVPDAQPGPRRAQGSGFVISEEGLIVTNSHVVIGAEEVEVLLEDGDRVPAEIVGTDPATDIAVLRIDAEDAPAPVEWGVSAHVDIGEWVVAIGNPFGLDGTVTTGILSARSRDINSGPYDNFLQTDAAINSGNSGGPLFNTAGEVVGVNTAIFSPSGGNVGIGFAVPSDVARAIVLDLQDDGTVSRGYLGVRVQHVGPELAEALGIEPGGVGDAGGALVAEVTEGSPAEAAGLVAGDVIVEVANAAVEDPRDLTFAVAELEPGSETTMTVMRDDGREQITVTIGEQPSDLFATAAPGGPAPGEPRLGVSVAPLDAETRDRAGIPEEVDGLLVAQVQGGTPAARAGLQQGDVIAEAGGAAVTQVSALRDAAAEAEEDDRPLLLRIWRGGGYNFVAIRFEDDAEDDDDADAG